MWGKWKHSYTPGKYLSHWRSCSVYTQDYLKMKLKEEFRFHQAQFPRSKGLFREQRPVIESIFDQLPVRSCSLLPLCQSLVPVSSLQL